MRQHKVSRASPGRGYSLSDSVRQQHIIVPPGMDIITEGDRSSRIYTICDGWAVRYRQVDGGRQILDVLLSGDTIALSSIVSGAVGHSVRAVTSMNVCGINGRQILGLLKSDPDFAFGVLRSRVEEESRSDARLTMLGRMTASEKIGHFAIEIYDRLRQRRLTSGTGCPFPLRRADLADAVGLSKVHVLRGLRELREQRLMEIVGRELTIPHVGRLAEYAGYRLT